MYFSSSKDFLSSFTSAVRAGTGGDEAGIWAGDLVGTWLHLSFPSLIHVECLKCSHM